MRVSFIPSFTRLGEADGRASIMEADGGPAKVPVPFCPLDPRGLCWT